MRKNILSLITAFLGVLMLFNACQPEKYELGTVISKDQLKFTIVQDTKDPNMILLVAENEGMTPLWKTPMGRSTRVVDTVKLAFPGSYKFSYGVQSSGGYIESDEQTVNVTTTNLTYVDDPLWTALSGGVGNEKTWYLDLNAAKESRYYDGPLYFYGTNNGWLGECLGADCWNWNPSWAGNTWLMPEGDYGSMTFNLKGNANVKVNHLMLNGKPVENGTYFLDKDAKTLKMTDARPLHDQGRDGQVVNWGDLKVMSLTEDHMQLCALRDKALSGEDPCLFVYNFVSKAYYDAWVAPVKGEPEPALPTGWKSDVTQVVTSTIKWVLSPQTPFNWCALDGSFLNSWNKITDYPDWTGFNATIPPTYAKFDMIFNSKDNSVKYTDPAGVTTTGTYALDDKGIYTFTGVKPSFNICSWVNLSTTADNQWRITKIEKDALGKVTGMWVGARDAVKPEYMVYKLIVEETGATVDPTQQVKNILCAQTWKLDAARTYDKTTSWGAEQGPVIFSDYATWSWNPTPGQQYAAGEAGVDYGTMKFDLNGKVTVKQHRKIYTYVDNGATIVRKGLPVTGDVLATDDIVTLNGIWVLNLDDNTLTLSVGALHPWTCDYAVANWGAMKIYRIEQNALLLQQQRDAALSGESAMPMTYIFVPSAKK